jgi:HNH endonuclease.
MRPVDKGVAPRDYTDYNDARHDLAGRIGYFCSYCEMPVTNMIEVEHVHPIDNGGNPTDWNNLLLSCKYCNTVKKARNANRVGYLWPDVDNTDLTFEYSEINAIEPKYNLPQHLKTYAQATIKLMGLDRMPGGREEPTEADTRWRSRKEVWDKANINLNRWNTKPCVEIAKIIADCAVLSGHYSIWCEVFKAIPQVLVEIDREYRAKGLYKEFDATGRRIIRQNANI